METRKWWPAIDRILTGNVNDREWEKAGWFAGRRVVEVLIHGSGLEVSCLVMKGRDIFRWVKGVEELAWDEGGKPQHSSYHDKPFPLSCVFAAEAMKVLKKAMEGATKTQSRSRERDRVNTLGWVIFSAGVWVRHGFLKKADSVFLACQLFHLSPHRQHWDPASSNFLYQGHHNAEESWQSTCSRKGCVL